MPAAEYISAVMAATPRAFWHLQDASGNPQDSSGNALHMTSVNGTPTYRASGPMSDFALSFDNNTEFTTRSTQVSTVVTNFTMEMWIYPLAIDTNGRAVFFNGGAADNRWGILMDTDGTFAFLANTHTTAAHTVNACPLNAWSHIVVLRRDTGGVSDFEYYFNGARDPTDPVDVAPTAVTGTSQLNAGNFMTARYAYVAVYESALSAKQIADHYTAAFAAGYRRIVGPQSLRTSASTLYTVPLGMKAELRSVDLNNPSASTSKVTLSVGADAASTRVLELVDVPAGGALNLRRGINHTLEAGEVLQTYAPVDALTAGLEKGRNGITITTSDAGDANAWDAVTIGAGGTLTYDNARAAHGALSAKFVSNNNSTRFDWTTASFGTETDWYGRIYVYFTSDPGSETVRPLDFYNSSDVRVAALIFRTPTADTVISLRDVALAEVAVGTVDLPLNQWVRIEWHLINSATAGFFEAKMFSADSTTALDTITSASNINTGVDTGRVRFGDTDGSILTWWMDDVLAGASSYPGPADPVVATINANLEEI